MKKIALAIVFGISGTVASASDDIKFYTTEYVGDDIAYENVGCGKPDIPEKSLTKAEIQKVADGVTAWRNCYNAYVEKLAALQPAGKALPAGLAEKMNPAELDMAKRRMAKVYEVVADEAAEVAKSVMAQNDAWMASTKENVALHEARQKDRQVQLERMKMTMDSPMIDGKAGVGGGRR